MAVNPKSLIHSCVGSDIDFLKNFPGAQEAITNGDPDLTTNFVDTITNIVINDVYSQPKNFYAHLVLAKLYELSVPQYNKSISDNDDLLQKIAIEIFGLWDEVKQSSLNLSMSRRALNNNYDKNTVNLLRLLLEFVSYINIRDGETSPKIKKLVGLLNNKGIILPKKFFIMKRNFEEINFNEPLEIDGLTNNPANDSVNLGEEQPSKFQQKKINNNYHAGDLQSAADSMISNYPLKLEEPNKRSTRTPPSLNSSRLDRTPPKYSNDLKEIEDQLQKGNRTKTGELSKIQEDIKKSFNVSGKKFNPTTDPQIEIDPDIRESYEKQIRDLKVQCDLYKQEINHLKRKNDQNAIDDLLNQMERLQNQITKMQQDNQKLKVDYAKKSQDYDVLNNDNRNAKNQYELNNISQIQEFKSKLKELQDKNSNLQNAMTDITNQNQNLVKKMKELQDSQLPRKTNNDMFSRTDDSIRLNMDDIILSTKKNILAENLYDSHELSKLQNQYDVDWRLPNDTIEILTSTNKAASQIHPPKGQVVYENYPIFDEVKKRLQTPPFIYDLTGFKLACLKSKALIYEDEPFQIGMTSSIVFNSVQGRNNIKIILYYGNMGYEAINNLNIKLSDIDRNLDIELGTDQLDTIIMPTKQTKQLFNIGFNSVPFGPLSVIGSYNYEGSNQKYALIIPATINKLMEFKYVNNQEFRAKWSLRKKFVYRSEEIEFDPEIIGNTYDFKKYFNYIIDLQPKNEYDYVQGKKSIKFAGVFELDIPDFEFLLKIVAFPNNKVAFQIAYFEQMEEVTKFLIKTLAFLFGQ